MHGTCITSKTAREKILWKPVFLISRFHLSNLKIAPCASLQFHCPLSLQSRDFTHPNRVEPSPPLKTLIISNGSLFSCCFCLKLSSKSTNEFFCYCDEFLGWSLLWKPLPLSISNSNRFGENKGWEGVLFTASRNVHHYEK